MGMLCLGSLVMSVSSDAWEGVCVFFLLSPLWRGPVVGLLSCHKELQQSSFGSELGLFRLSEKHGVQLRRSKSSDKANLCDI